jgi:hypothetical protein
MISMQHGDILTAENLAPSYYVPGPTTATTAYNEGSAEASNGFITVLADYLGYGASKNLFHRLFIDKVWQQVVQICCWRPRVFA